MSKKRTKNSRKGKVMKETPGHRRAMLARKRRDPAFREHEKRTRAETILATDYLAAIVHEEDLDEFFATNDRLVTLEGMAVNDDMAEAINDHRKKDDEREAATAKTGLEELHEFLYGLLDALKDDYADRLDEKGYLTLSALTPDAIEFVFLDDEDKEKAIDGENYVPMRY